MSKDILVSTLSYWPDKEFEVIGVVRGFYNPEELEYFRTIKLDSIDRKNSGGHYCDTTATYIKNYEDDFLDKIDAIIDWKISGSSWIGTAIKFK